MSELVDRILDDLNDRQGFDLTVEVRGWLRDAWQPMIKAENAALKQLVQGALTVRKNGLTLGDQWYEDAEALLGTDDE